MNYPNQPGNDRPRRPNLFLLLMLGAMALFLFSQYQKSQQQVPRPEISIPDISTDGNLGAQRGADWRQPQATAEATGTRDAQTSGNSDWSLDTSMSTKSSSHAAATSNRTSNDGTVEAGDWSLDTSTKSAAATNGATRSTGQPQAKTTREGDWSLGEVETKK